MNDLNNYYHLVDQWFEHLKADLDGTTFVTTVACDF